VVCQAAPALQHDVLLHGDYCLPNIILKDGKLSGFIDLGNGGLGDRHIDLHWGIWSLQYNLKTDQWTDRFLDAYGRDKLNPQLLDSIRAFEVFL
jgi:kanamycin kinase